MSDRDSKERSPEEGEGGFRVIDRRRFTADGTERSPDAGEAATETPTAASAGQGAERRATADAAREAEADEPTLGLPRGDPYGEAEGPIEPTFSTLVMSLSTQALMCLGEIPEVVGQPPRRDMAAARSVIDLLGILEQKTRGNLDAGEEALLERILYDLRMRFVELSKS